MWLIVVYVILMIAGDILAYLLGLFVERTWPAASLPTFLAMYFGFLWVSWLIAVKITEPKTENTQAA
jgi:divalent metal cation (Fe/Co/Zn/Cd) transporter